MKLSIDVLQLVFEFNFFVQIADSNVACLGEAKTPEENL